MSDLFTIGEPLILSPSFSDPSTQDRTEPFTVSIGRVCDSYFAESAMALEKKCDSSGVQKRFRGRDFDAKVQPHLYRRLRRRSRKSVPIKQTAPSQSRRDRLCRDAHR